MQSSGSQVRKRVVESSSNNTWVTQEAALVSCHSCDKLPDTQWLKTTQMCYLMVLQARSLTRVSSLAGLNSRCRQGCSCCRLYRDAVSWAFPASRSCLDSLAHGSSPSFILMSLSDNSQDSLSSYTVTLASQYTVKPLLASEVT
jgi:hypothetical protein